jgi:hypothetical protein
MIKGVRLFWFFLAMAVIVTSNGCRHKPAYSDIDANKSSSTYNQNSADKAGTTAAPAAAELPPTAPSQPAGSPPAAQSFKAPAFMDQATGAIKDLPNYPRSTKAGVQIGPNKGLNVMTLVLQTNDSMDLIAAFYQKVIKDNQWTVVDKLIDPDMSEWILKKGEENSARIQVRKDQATSRKNISIVRGEKLEETSK